MKITDVVLWRIEGDYQGPSFPAGSRQAKQIDIYPEFDLDETNTGSEEGARPISALYVEILTDEQLSGLWGPIQEFQSFFVLRSLRPFLVGRDPLAIELLHDQMIRLDRHGRTGMYMTAISAVNNALWDLKGKAWSQPVYRLLGGPTRAAVPAYASMLGFSTEPDAAATLAEEYRAKGYSAQKWFFRFGPGQGDEGLARNLALAEAVRHAVGPNYTLMFDAFMGWDLPYATRMLQRLAHLRPFWMEEPVPPERFGTLRQLRETSDIPIATGEHVYTRWQTKELLVSNAVDVLQNDPDWTGGITELVKICALASSFDTPVVAHGHSLLPALHVAGSQFPSVVPFVEYLIRNQEVKQYFHTDIVRPDGGRVHLPDKPGLGITLDDAKIERRMTVTA